MSKKLTNTEFLEKCKNIHGDKYTYPDEYVNAITPIRIICPIHGEFYQSPNGHTSGRGCKNCNKTKTLTTKEFINKANKAHNNKYDYPDEYICNKDKIRIICPKHGEFFQRSSSHLGKSGCPKCNKSKKLTTKEFINKANTVHNNKYDYPDKYVNSITSIRITCPIHGEFKQNPGSHLSGKGCSKCKIEIAKITKTHDQFLNDACLIHGEKYTYPVQYTHSCKKIKIICPIHGEFFQRPKSHTCDRNGCPQCFNTPHYSQKAISWLDSIMNTEGIFIQHAENDGEYSIPGTKYKADGYCEANNTIYEFYGDKFHGNLKLFNENEQCHPFSDESAGSLYIKTMKREQIIKKLGYNLITIWEHDFV